VVFTYLFGGAIAGSPAEYLRFILPGTLVMTVLLVTSPIGIALNTDLGKGTFDRFRSMPIWRPAPIVGSLLGEVVRYLIAATVVLTLGIGIGYRPQGGEPGVVLAVGLVVVFAFALSWMWTTLALLLRSPASVTAVGFLIQFPLTLVSMSS
jgi:ABC-2 type transport system permease protein